MRGTTYTKQENEKLLEEINAAISLCGNYIQWAAVKEVIEGRTLHSMQSQWSRHLKRACLYNGSKYVLKEPNLFNAETHIPKRDSPKKTPQIKSVRISRSFLWGAIKYERYE